MNGEGRKKPGPRPESMSARGGRGTERPDLPQSPGIRPTPVWEKYGQCGTCGVLPGAPCVDLRVSAAFLSNMDPLRYPHKGRHQENASGRPRRRRE